MFYFLGLGKRAGVFAIVHSLFCYLYSKTFLLPLDAGERLRYCGTAWVFHITISLDKFTLASIRSMKSVV